MVEKPAYSMRKGTLLLNEQVKTLLSIWPEANIQKELNGIIRIKSVYQKISKHLYEAGLHKDWVQCRTKPKNLKTTSKSKT